MPRAETDAGDARMPPPQHAMSMPSTHHSSSPLAMPLPSPEEVPSGPAQALTLADVPSSVRGAPIELRRIIRKRQNSESAKRCRLRKKMETARASEEMYSQSARLHALEAAVTRLSAQLEATHRAIAHLGGQPSFTQHAPQHPPQHLPQHPPEQAPQQDAAKNGCWSPVTHATQPMPQGIDVHTEQLHSLLGRPGLTPPLKSEELWR